jgi:hypothetical protein
MSLSRNFPTIRPSLLLDFASAGRLDPRITFARNSPAVYYDGVTETVAEQNLLLQSQSLAAGTWTVLAMTLSDNAAVAPDGTTTASRVTETTATSEHYTAQTLTTFSGGNFTYSVYLKKGTLATAPDWAQLACGGTNSGFVSVNLATGVIGNTSGFTSTAIQNAGSGWYRVSVTSNVAAGAISFRIGTTNNTNANTRHVTYAGSTTSDVLVWGAQVENRLTLTAYTTTTTQTITNYIPTLVTASANTARFDSNPTTSVALGLLIEEARTNLALYSEEWNNATWIKFNTTITANAAVSPGGTVTADAVVENTAAGAYHAASQDLVKAAVATTYTFSLYAKSANRTIGLRLSETSPGTSGAVTAYNLATGALVTTAGTYGTTFTNASGSITAVGNGWYRVSLTVTSGPETSIQAQVYMQNGANSVYTGDGWSNILVWGAQVEVGAGPSSYIATVATTQTRQADTAVMTGTNFSSWFNASEFTIVTQSTLALQPGTFPRLVSINNGVNNNEFLRQSANGDTLKESNFVTSGGVTQFNFFNDISRNTTYKKALAVKLNNNAYARNDFTSVQTSVTGSTPLGCNQISIMGDSVNGPFTIGYINRLYVYPLRLTDTQIFNLTR